MSDPVDIDSDFDIDIDDVSTDVTTGMMRYMMSVERQKQLIGISPVVRAIQSTVKTNVEKNIVEYKKKELTLKYSPKPINQL